MYFFVFVLTDMDHYLFECMEKRPFFTEEDTLEGWYVMLYDRAARWSGRQDYRCAVSILYLHIPILYIIILSYSTIFHKNQFD